MFKILIKKWIKNYNDVNNSQVREKYGTLCSTLSIVCNIVLVIFKFTIGVITNSIAIQADGLNNLSDVGSNLASLFGFKLANKHPDETHPYGHGRVEYVAGLIIAFLILLVGIQSLKDSIIKIIEPQKVTFTFVAVIILIVSNESKLLNTVKSRCVKIEFSKLTNEEINNYLQGCGASKLSNTLLEQCDGSLKKALTIGDKAQDYETVEKIINNLDKVDIAKVWNSADLLYKSQDEILDFLDYINVVLYNKLIEKDKMAYINSINVVEQTKKNLLANANYNMCIDNLLLKLWEEFNEQNNRG